MAQTITLPEIAERTEARSASRALHLLFAANFPRTTESGIGKHLHSLAAALVQRGHRVDLLFAEDFPRARNAGRAGRIVFPWEVAREIRRRVRSGVLYDAVNLHEPSGMFYALARRWDAGLPPLVVTSHGVEQRAWEMNPDGAHRSLKTRLLFPLTQLRQANHALRHADAVACLSLEDADYLTARLKVPAARVHRLSNGVDAALFEIRRRTVQEPALLFMGTWLPRKGTPELVRAFGKLRRQFPWLRLTVLGAGMPEFRVLETFSAEDRLGVNVVAQFTAGELPGYLEPDQIFVLPSRFEGMPLSLLEAMAAGLPCVTTATCGMRDLIQQGRGGFLVPPGDEQALADSLASLLVAPSLRKSQGAAARETASRRTWDQVAQQWESLFLKAAGAGLARQYDAWHREVAGRDDDEKDLNNPWHRFARVAVGEVAQKRVLEVACGRGQLSAWLQRQGARTASVDFSFAALLMAQPRLRAARGTGQAICGDAQVLPFADCAFDLVVSCETLEHLPDPRRCLRELARVLKPGGRLVLTTENYLNIWGFYRLYLAARGRRFNSGDDPQPIEQWMFSLSTRRWIRQAGLQIEYTDGESHHLCLLPGTQPSETEVVSLSSITFLRRALRFFGRRFFVVATRGAISANGTL